MIPLVATVHVRVRQPDGGGFRLWLPVPLVILWLLLLPIAAVLLPVFVVACLAGRLPPLRTLSALWSVVSALGGTDVALEHREATIHIHL